jgi:nucleotide-binding universal stress UspA family protein
MADMAPRMQWIIGLDFRPSCVGALAWADWLREHSGGSQQCVAAHVVELPPGWVGPMIGTSRIEEDARRFLRECDLALDVRVLDTMTPVEGLAHAVAIQRADALAIGRRSTVNGDEIVRLGRVARRLLRRLPAPLAICPADLEPEELPLGPVLIAVAPDAPSVAAARFGLTLARSIGREAVFGSVVRPAFPIGVTYLAAAQYRGHDEDMARAELAAWFVDQGADETVSIVSEGPVVPCLYELAMELRACAIVCGSRMLSATDRITQSSVGTALASIAPIPVIDVPAPDVALSPD